MVAAKDGVPVLVRDIGDVMVGNEVRRGAVTADGKGEVVLGLGFMLMGENSHDVTWRLKDRLQDIEPTLPPGVNVQTVYDRTELVDHVIDTVRGNLFEGGLLVVAVLFVFLGNLRAGLIVALAIPLSMLFAFTGMLRFGISASLLSLGALDFGLVVDSSVIMIENVVRHLAHDQERRPHLEVVRDAALEVRRPTMFGELIILIVYLPILTLEGVEGKLFRPMALTVIFALLGSLVLSLTLMPVLASLLLPRGRSRSATRSSCALLRLRSTVPMLRAAPCAAAWWSSPALLSILALRRWSSHAAWGPSSCRGSREGAIVVNVVRLAGTDLDESVRYNTQMERAVLATFPDEVEHVWSRIGSAEVATDPMGVELTDVFITLKPRARWTRAKTQAELTTLVHRALRDMPGQRIASPSRSRCA